MLLRPVRSAGTAPSDLIWDFLLASTSASTGPIGTIYTGVQSKPGVGLTYSKYFVPARSQLELLRQEVHETTAIVSRRRHASSRNAHAASMNGSWSARVDSTIAVIDACFQELDAADNTCPVTLQQVVHFTRRCSGPICVIKDSPIYGVRYECTRCEHDYCVSCYENHDPEHVLHLHRTVLQEHAATAASEWEVLRIDKHADDNSGRTYRVVWAGNWEPEFVTRASLNNDDLVDRHTHARLLVQVGIRTRVTAQTYFIHVHANATTIQLTFVQVRDDLATPETSPVYNDLQCRAWTPSLTSTHVPHISTLNGPEAHTDYT